MIQTKDFTNNYFTILEETFESPIRDGNTYLDRQTGWFPTLQSLSAARASWVLPGGSTSIAGQVFHAKFYLETLEGYLTGRITGKTDWRTSWVVQSVTAGEWEALTDGFKVAYERVKVHLKANTVWDDDGVGDALAILVHSAYHLGAVRQMMQVSD